MGTWDGAVTIKDYHQDCRFLGKVSVSSWLKSGYINSESSCNVCVRVCSRMCAYVCVCV